METILFNTKTFHPLILVFIVGTFFIGCSDSNPSASSSNDTYGPVDLEKAFAAITPEELSPEEEVSLVFMREEEKLARDVYITMIQRWGHRTFGNISRSESAHMNAVLVLLNRYGIADPVGNNGVGMFTNQNLQVLYNQLVEHGPQRWGSD